MLRYACLALILLWCNTSAFAQQGRRMQGYLKQDVKVFEGTQTLRRGEKIACNVMPDGKRCCFEEEAGTVCVELRSSSPARRRSRLDTGKSCRAQRTIDLSVAEFDQGVDGVDRRQLSCL